MSTTNVCADQDTYNKALRDAIKYNQDENRKEMKKWAYVYLGLWLVFFVWGLMLAMKMPSGAERVQHVLFALVFGPMYVLAHYLGLKKN